MGSSDEKKQVRSDQLTYDEAKRLARHEDPEVRAHLASRGDVRPEILYFLAEDSSAEVRRCIAANTHTPSHADLILARDVDEHVRRQLADKVGKLLPDMSAKERAKAQQCLEETLELLARDQATRVRQILAETLKTLPNVPPHIVMQLARDVEDVVACPILEFSPVLTDEGLLEFLAAPICSIRIQAVARRQALGEAISDAIVETQDPQGVAALLGNASAQIREETLDALIEESARVVDWQAPLVARPTLSRAALSRLTRIVSTNLLARLEARPDLGKDTAKIIAAEITRRLDKDPKARPGSGNGEDSHVRATRLHARGELNEDVIKLALSHVETDFVRHALALRAGFPIGIVDRILAAGSAKAVTALAWKAGLSMRFAHELQVRLGGLASHQILKPRGGTDYPLPRRCSGRWSSASASPSEGRAGAPVRPACGSPGSRSRGR